MDSGAAAACLLARVPGVVIALVVATAILGIAAASGPLFLSSVGSATLTQQITDSCPERSLPGVSNPAVNDPNFLGPAAQCRRPRCRCSGWCGT
ncbi:MAG: hypothetical protein WKF47_07000 [Geodermatophilaceae bacterium]